MRTPGLLTAVLGPNGAGKTTLIRCCTGLLTPASGALEVLGEPPGSPANAARVGLMPQSTGAWSGIRAVELLSYLASLYAHPLDVPAIVERLGIGGFARTPYRRLSGGQQQAVNLAGALIGRPELVFLDEPTAGMDPHARRATWELLRELRASGVSIVLTTHAMDEAETLADQVFIVDDGVGEGVRHRGRAHRIGRHSRRRLPGPDPAGGRLVSTIDFSPAPGAAPASTRIVRHAITEATLLVRNGEQLLLALVIPLGILLGGRFFGGRFGDLDSLAPSVLGLAVWSSAFTSVAITTGFERRYGVLERLAATPLGKPGLLAGKALAVTVILLGQLVILVAAALIIGWRPAFTVGSFFAAVLLVILASATFVCLGLLLAGLLRAEIILAVANLIYLVLLAAGGLLMPVDRYIPAVRPVVSALPTGALGEGLRAAASGVVLGWPLAVLAIWLVLAGLAARRFFRWTS